MAIAGLHNLSVFDSSLLRESQSSTARQRGDHVRSSTRASSIRQMWRELEDEHVVSRARERVGERLIPSGSDGLRAELLRADVSDNGSESRGTTGSVVGVDDCDTWSHDQAGSENDHGYNSDLSSEHSSDFGEVERQRVRQIFREWMNSGAKERTSNVDHVNNSSRAEWLGETEQERVRIIRGWVQMNTQQSGDHREEQAAEIGSQIEQVLDGLVVNQGEARAEHPRRGIRKLCGRQALLDMLKKAERERQSELEGLVERRAVSRFAHRNRIQSLLRGRFLRNDRVIRDEKPTSIAASELGLLRQRHTVSGLREGFISRLDSGQASSNLSDTSSNSDINCMTNYHTIVNSSDASRDDFHHAESHNAEIDDSEANDRNGMGGNESTNLLESTNIVGEQEQHLNQARDRQQPGGPTLTERSDSLLDRIANDCSMDNLQNEAQGHSFEDEASDGGTQSEVNSEENTTQRLLDHSNNQEDHRIENIPLGWSAMELGQWQEQGAGTDGGDSQRRFAVSTEIRDFTRENDAEADHQNIDESHGLLESEIRENGHLQEDSALWDEDGSFQGTEHSWPVGHADHPSLSAGRVNMFYLPDDDNVNSTEIRELLSRRSVSNLLHSSFRESLDQLIQSYVERQGHGPSDLDLEGTSPSTVADEDFEQQNRDLSGTQDDAVDPPSISLPSTQMPRARSIWDQESSHDNWDQHEMHQRFGIDWEVVNDLRIDMARLQQRMNNMQRMLEACMDMQLELQRSIRQEVSAALNRTVGSPGECEINLPKDGSQWDHVRKGICCICCENSIDSLLYRCGHMCTCTNCATKLVQSGGKCPMCRAPVVEVIRAYSIL